MEIKIQIADIVFSLSCGEQFTAGDFLNIYSKFLSPGEPEVFIQTGFDSIPEASFSKRDKVFDSGSFWRIYRKNGKYAFLIRSGHSPSKPHCLAYFGRDFKNGDVHYNHTHFPAGGPRPNPMEYPLFDLLMRSLLAKNRGLMVHGCGIIENGRGILFLGNSGHGKTTMARLWKDCASILNDDRIILRNRGNRIWMYGTPWHGEYKGVSPERVPLEKIFFLRHGETNTFRLCNTAEAAAMILTRCFPLLWDAAGMEHALAFCGQVAAAVPCFELDFVPHIRVVEFVKCLK